MLNLPQQRDLSDAGARKALVLKFVDGFDSLDSNEFLGAIILGLVDYSICSVACCMIETSTYIVQLAVVAELAFSEI